MSVKSLVVDIAIKDTEKYQMIKSGLVQFIIKSRALVSQCMYFIDRVQITVLPLRNRF